MKLKEKMVWSRASMKRKVQVFIAAVVLILLMFAALEIGVVRFTFVDFNRIIEGNSLSSELIHAMDEETENFERYVKDSTQERKEDLERSIEQMARCIAQMPYDYSEEGKEIYRLTWNIRNAYDVYVKHRDMLIRQGDSMQNYIAELYSIYDMQKYLMGYLRLLSQENVYLGNNVYFSKYPWIVITLAVIAVLITIAILLMMRYSKIIHDELLHPLDELAGASRKIAENNFYIEDIVPRTEDEVGELVTSFNTMKNAMGKYAQAMEENRSTREKLHEQQMERVEMERQLETAKMEVLVSQMNPHFLFNTLNIIAGMANLENADISEKMTRSLSNLLRYTIHNELAAVPLSREIRIAEEYNYLQHMRFGARVRFQIDCRVDADAFEIPSFTFQPLIENAIIHGVAPKIEGGTVRVRISLRGENLVILVADNGIGMSREQVEKLRAGELERTEKHAGIAFHNIRQRFETLYPESRIELYSKKDAGTLVKITVPAREAACIEY